MNERVCLSSFTGADDRARFAAALDYLKAKPGTTLIVEPGIYNITSERARWAQKSVMNGEFGSNPEPVMFSPGYVYDIGLDFNGHKNSTVEGYGATLMIDGFMENISIRNCSGVTVRGFTMDHKRKPYSKGIIRALRKEGDEMIASVDFADEITPKMPSTRSVVYSRSRERFIPDIAGVGGYRYVDEHHCEFPVHGMDESNIGDEVYIWHTFHSRPAIMVLDAVNTLIEDVTIHSHPGMGITAQHGTNITVNRLRVIPSVGEHLSTNTDATHFESCRGLLRLDGCYFDGQGDDSINVHTYYYTVEEHNGREAILSIKAPTGTHAQKLDYPLIGDRMELTEFDSLDPVDTFTVTGVICDYDSYNCRVIFDRDLPESMDGLFFSDPDELPHVEFVNCVARNHFARSILIKSRTCLIENCTVSDVFELGVKIAAEAWWHEGINSESVTVRRCRFINNGRVSSLCGGIGVYMDTDKKEMSHGNVVIEDNIIECPNCEHGIIVDNVKRAVVRRNSIVCRGEPVEKGQVGELITD